MRQTAVYQSPDLSPRLGLPMSKAEPEPVASQMHTTYPSPRTLLRPIAHPYQPLPLSGHLTHPEQLGTMHFGSGDPKFGYLHHTYGLQNLNFRG